MHHEHHTVNNQHVSSVFNVTIKVAEACWVINSYCSSSGNQAQEESRSELSTVLLLYMLIFLFSLLFPSSIEQC